MLVVSSHQLNQNKMMNFFFNAIPKSLICTFLLFFILQGGWSQGNTCVDAISLNTSYPIIGNGQVVITVDNRDSNQFYTYKANSEGTIEMSSCMDISGTDTYLRVYSGSCDSLLFAGDGAGCLMNTEFIVEVDSNETIIFEWSNQKEGGVFEAIFYFHEPVSGELCEDPQILNEGLNTKDYWFGNQYYHFEATRSGLLEVNTCGLQDDISIIIYEGCSGILLAETDYFLCEEDPFYDNQQARTLYQMTEGEEVIIEVGPFGNYTELTFDFNVIFTPTGYTCDGPILIDDAGIYDVKNVPSQDNDQWYKFKSPKSGDVIITTLHSALADGPILSFNEETHVKIYDDCDGNLVAENDDYTGYFGASRINMSVAEDSTYFIKMIDQFINDSYRFEIFYEEDLLIGTESSPIATEIGYNAHFANLHYVNTQWFQYVFSQAGIFSIELNSTYDYYKNWTTFTSNKNITVISDEDSGTPSGFFYSGEEGDTLSFSLNGITNNTFYADFESSVVTMIKEQMLSVSIFPNPASDRLSIKLLEGQNVQAIEVFSLIGNMIPVQWSKAPNGTLEVNIGQLAAGTYLLKLNGVSSYRFVKE